MINLIFNNLGNNQGGLLSRMFSKITEPVRELVDGFKLGLQDTKDAENFWENNDEIARLSAIEYIYKWAYEDVTNTNDISAINERLAHHLEHSKDHMNNNGIGEIRIEELTAYGAELTDIKKAGLEQSRLNYQNTATLEL